MTARVGAASPPVMGNIGNTAKTAKTVSRLGRDDSVIYHHARARGKTAKTEQGAYRVTLVALAGDPPAAVRLRPALKTLLRTYRPRCCRVEIFPKPGPSDSFPKPARGRGRDLGGQS